MSFAWHSDVLPEEQEKFVEQATYLVSNYEFFKNNPKFPHESIRQIAFYFVSQAWNSATTKQLFLQELKNIPYLAENHYRPVQEQSTPPSQTLHQTVQQTHNQSNHQITTQQNFQNQPSSHQPSQPQHTVSDTQLFWEAFIGITKNKQECDKLRNDYNKAKQILEKFKEKRKKFVTVREHQEVDNRIQQLELITKNLKVYFSDHHKHYQTFLEKNKDEIVALSNLINNSPIKRADQEIKMLKSLSTILQKFETMYESWSKELKNKQTEHVSILKELFTIENAHLSDNLHQTQQDEKMLQFLCESVQKLVEFPSFDDFAASTNQSNKRKLVDIYQSIQPNKLRKFEEDLFPMKNFMKQILLQTIHPSSHTFYDSLQEKLKISLGSRFSITFRNAKTKFELDIRHFPRDVYNPKQDNFIEEQEEFTIPQLVSPVSVSSVSELSCTTNLTDLQNVNTFQDNENSKQFVIEIALYAKLEDETKSGFLQLYLCPPMRIHVNYSQTGIDLIDPIIDFTTEGMENPKAKQYSMINTSINADSGRLLLSGPLQLSFIKENVMRNLNQEDPIIVKVRSLMSYYLESALLCIDSVSISE